MGLELNLSGNAGTFKVAEVAFIRALGEPVQWRYTAEVTRDSRGGQRVKTLAETLLRSSVRVQPFWREPGNLKLGPEGTVVGARWLPQVNVDYLEIEAHGTGPEPSPDPFLPRRRVHKANNMRELVDRFKNIAKPVEGLKAELEQIEFPYKEKTSIIQDGVSDWLFFSHVLDQCRFLAKGTPKWLPMILFGGVDEKKGTTGRWVVTPGFRAAYEEWGDVERRKISFQDGRDKDGDGRFEFSRVHSLPRVPDFPSGSFPSVIFWRPRRKFEQGKWQQWRTTDLPRFTEGGALVWRIEDRLYQSGRETIGWETRLFALPPEAQMNGPSSPVRLRPWLGLGKVQTSSDQDPWIKVRLDGFESGEELADVRLSTPFSGTDGKKGLHFVPAQNTEVKLCWSGRFDTSLIFLGNARSQATDFAAPSLYLQKEYTAHYEDVHVERIGDVTVDSNLSMAVRQQTHVASTQSLKIQADGADLKMNNGVVYTGRGL